MLAVTLLDQASKYLCLSWMVPAQPYALFPGLNGILVYNYGAAFSFLAKQSGWQRWFFILISLLIATSLIVYWRKYSQKQPLEKLALGLILGGALGNLIDRCIHGYVIDFIQVYYQAWAWPVFNLADSAISVGAAIWILATHRK